MTNRLVRAATSAAACIALVAVSTVAAVVHDERPAAADTCPVLRHERSIGGQGLAALYAWGLQYNPVSDEILVGDYFNFVVRRYDRAGNELGSFGRPATERNGQFYTIGVDPRDGAVYVPEIGDGQPMGYIAKYSKTGEFLYAFHVNASYYGWITVGDDGLLYIADSHYWHTESDPPKVRVFSVNDGTKSATQIRSFGSFGSDPGEIGNIHGLDVDAAGNIYAADAQNLVVNKYSPTGALLDSFGDSTIFRGDLRGLTVDRTNGIVWVVDAQDGNIERFTTGGTWLGSVSDTGNGPGEFADGGRQIDVLPDGTVWVADYGNFRAQHLDGAGGFLGQVPSPERKPLPGYISKTRDVEVAPDGDVWVADTWNHRFQKFSGADGSSLGAWGHRASGPPYGMNYPRGVGIDPSNGNVWVADTREHILRVYDSSANFLFNVGSGVDSPNPGDFRWPMDVAFTGTSAIITDYSSGWLKGVSASTGAELWRFKTNNNGVAIDPVTGRIYVVSWKNDKVDVYTSTRTYLFSFGSNGTTAGKFREPWDIDIFGGRVYVSDAELNRVSIYSLLGQHTCDIGTTGSGPGQFRDPSGISHDAAGRLYVADSSNYRVAVLGPAPFTPDGTPPVAAFTSPAQNAAVAHGTVVVTGTATDPAGTARVEVSVRDTTTGLWWDPGTSSWSTTTRWALAALTGTDPHALTFKFPFTGALNGHNYTATARATDFGNVRATSGLPQRAFRAVAMLDSLPPETGISVPVKDQVFPGRPAAISGTATDDLDVERVDIAIKDRTTNLWWNPVTETWGVFAWRPVGVDTPNSTSTAWSYDFDDSANPGSGLYFMQVRSVDGVGNVDASLSTTRFSIA